MAYRREMKTRLYSHVWSMTPFTLHIIRDYERNSGSETTDFDHVLDSAAETSNSSTSWPSIALIKLSRNVQCFCVTHTAHNGTAVLILLHGTDNPSTIRLLPLTSGRGRTRRTCCKETLPAPREVSTDINQISVTFLHP